MISWKPFSSNGQSYDLSHLHPQLVTYKQPAKNDKPERIYEVQVIYGLHCFTRSNLPGDSDELQAYSDSRETRQFDQYRYQLSKQLPAILQALPTMDCFHTGHGNFFTVKLLDQETGRAEVYEVYFRASRSSTKPARVNLFVESAYLRDREHDNRPKRKKKINFFVILHNILHRKPINPAP